MEQPTVENASKTNSIEERQKAFDSKAGVFFTQQVLENVLNEYVDVGEAVQIIHNARSVVEGMKRNKIDAAAIRSTAVSAIKGVPLTSTGESMRNAFGSTSPKLKSMDISFEVDLGNSPESAEGVLIALKRAEGLLKLCLTDDTLDRTRADLIRKVLQTLA